jgi:hypothetical protein
MTPGAGIEVSNLNLEVNTGLGAVSDPPPGSITINPGSAAGSIYLGP